MPHQTKQPPPHTQNKPTQTNNNNKKQIGRVPWLGRFTYSKQGDPWKAAAGRAYMRRWYSALLGVLARGGLDYPVHGAFVWNCASWDVQGVYSSEYTEPGVIALVRRHNAAVLRARGGSAAH